VNPAVSGTLEIASALVSALSERGQTVAIAESLTGGLVCAALVEVPGASAVLRGAVVSYATDLKGRLLGVDEDLLARRGPVDPTVATQMASGVRERLSADWGLATTGVAGPDPQNGVQPGRVYVAIAAPQVRGVTAGSQTRNGVLELDLPGNRALVRAASTEHALRALLAALADAGR
jgi:nicotinamide-nucleotide amidase